MSEHTLRQLSEAMPIVSLLLFVLIFALVLVYVLSDRRRGHLARMGAKALEDARPARGHEER